MTMHACVCCLGDNGRDHRRLGVHRGRAAPPAAPSTPTSTCASPPATPQAGTPRRRPLPEPGRRLRDLAFETYDPDRLRRPRPRLPRPAPRRVARTSCPSSPGGSATSSTWPPTSGCATRRSTRSGTARSTPRPSCSADFVYGLPELFRDRHRRRRRTSPRRAATSTAAVLALAPAAAGRPGRAHRHRRRRRQRRVGRRPAAKPTTTFCTVDEDFTAYGLLDHRHTPEIEQG